MAAKRKRPAAPKSTNGSGDLLKATLDEVAAMGWRETTIAAVAARAGVSEQQAAIWAPTKLHLAGRIMQGIDQQTFARVSAVDESSTPRDRLFDVLMKRFDALQANRDAVKAVVEAAVRNPPLAAAMATRLSCSMASVLAAAGISPRGPLGCLRTVGLKAVYMNALRQWMRDDSADMSKTMAALDKALNWAERAASFRLRPAKQEA